MSQPTMPQDPEGVRATVRESYTRVAERSSGCCGGTPAHAKEVSQRIGYGAEEMEAIPEGANLGLGCGNPTAIDALRTGEVVVDLGAGAGIDAFLAARQVGPTGRVIGVDMTDAMLDKARENARKGGYVNVEFRKGNIEALPIDDASADVVISNCVINLSPEKSKVFAEAFRVLRPGGRLMVSDIVLERPLPDAVREGIEAYVGCVGGASLRSEYLRLVEEAGFSELRVAGESSFKHAVSMEDPLIVEARESFGATEEQVMEVLGGITSLKLFARK